MGQPLVMEASPQTLQKKVFEFKSKTICSVQENKITYQDITSIIKVSPQNNIRKGKNYISPCSPELRLFNRKEGAPSVKIPIISSPTQSAKQKEALYQNKLLTRINGIYKAKEKTKVFSRRLSPAILKLNTTAHKSRMQSRLASNTVSNVAHASSKNATISDRCKIQIVESEIKSSRNKRDNRILHMTSFNMDLNPPKFIKNRAKLSKNIQLLF